jgi:hypothetical protein
MKQIKNLLKNRVSLADSMVLVGIGLAASYWVLESLFNIFTTQEINFFNQLLGPDINEVSSIPSTIAKRPKRPLKSVKKNTGPFCRASKRAITKSTWPVT